MATTRKRKDRWQAQVRRKGSAPLSKTFTLQKDALLWAKKMEILADKGEIPSVRQNLAVDSTLSDLIRRYIQTVTSTKRCAEYETIILQALLRHPISQKTIKELEVKDFANYRDDRLNGISAASLKRQLNPVRHMFQIAIDEWGIPLKENPLDKLKLKAKDNKRERRLRGRFESC